MHDLLLALSPHDVSTRLVVWTRLGLDYVDDAGVVVFYDYHSMTKVYHHCYCYSSSALLSIHLGHVLLLSCSILMNDLTVKISVTYSISTNAAMRISTSLHLLEMMIDDGVVD